MTIKDAVYSAEDIVAMTKILLTLVKNEPDAADIIEFQAYALLAKAEELCESLGEIAS